MRNISQLFKQWGVKHRQLPPNNDSMKAKVLETLHARERVTVQKPGRMFRSVWMPMAATALAVVVIFISQNVNHRLAPATSMPYREDFGMQEASQALSLGKASNIVPDNWGYEKPTIEDIREFQKTGYNTSIKTREVDTLGMRIQTMIRGYGGRVDNASVGSKSGYITFVIPKSSFASFTMELKDVVPKRFLTENVNTQNLLPQKQYIENQTESTSQQLDALETKRQSLVNTHDARVGSLQRQINAYANSIATLHNEVTTSTVSQQEINSQVAALEAKQSATKKQLTQVNVQFQNDLRSVDGDIQGAKARLTNLGTQNQNLLNDVETVNGYISLQWISVFEMVNLYVPVYGIVIFFCCLVIVGYFLYGRQRSFDLDVL